MKISRLQKQYLLAILSLIISLILAFVMVLFLAIRPRLRGEAEASRVAQQFVDFEKQESIQLYNGKKAYYSVIGQTAEGSQRVVAIGQKDGDVYVFDMASGLDVQTAQEVAKTNGAEEISKIVFGIYDGRPIWEVTAENGYYLVDFQSGDLIKREGL